MSIAVRRDALRRGTALLGAILAIIASAVIAGSISSSAESAGPTTVPSSWKKKPTAARGDEANPEKPQKAPPKSASTNPAVQHTTTTPAAEQAPKPEVEVYVPSVAKLRQAAVKSRTAEVYRGLAGMLPTEVNETGEGMDLAAVLSLLERMAAWPDTSVALAIYKQDREGRPRWAVHLDWPLAMLRDRIEELLDAEAGRQLLKDIKLGETEEGGFRLELPDHLLAVLSSAEDKGSLISSDVDVTPPATVFGQPSKAGEDDDSTEQTKKTKRPMLLYSRLNLAGDDDGPSPFAMFSGVRDICYGLLLDDDGLWNEKIVVSWSPLVGTALKMAFRKTDKPFECPRKSYCAAAFNLGLGEGMADGVTGFPPGTIGSKASGAAAVSVVPGSGFLPFPDIYYQFRTSKKDRITESVRKAIDEDCKERKESDRPRAWREQRLGQETIFWRDPTADSVGAIMPVTYRTVIFFDQPPEGETGETRLIVAQASTRADQAVAHWRELMKGSRSRITVPDSPKAHWQGRISWSSAYGLLQPYLCFLASLAADSALPPTADELEDALTDSVVDVRIEYAGLQVRHHGPIPMGAFYVPGIVAASLGSSASMWSEAGREQIACRHLRVLYHHAKLFKADYGRWPATVAELDGYVDFASHPDLLYLRQQDRGFVERFAATFTTQKKPGEAVEEGDIDDSLYTIDWTPDDWRLGFRDGEFKNYASIYIDTDGEIHRTPKPATTQPKTAAARGGEEPKEP
jgi:hypothetical protein